MKRRQDSYPDANSRRILGMDDQLPQFVDATRIASMLSVEPEYVRANWRELGGIRLPSDGGQGRLRFDPARVCQHLEAGDPEPQPAAAKRTAKARSAITDLLPVRGKGTTR
jgi:hypothetical protein